MDNSHSQLSLSDRHQIQALNGLGYSARKIAINMKRSNKTWNQQCHPIFGIGLNDLLTEKN